jgi:hypothetical protein
VCIPDVEGLDSSLPGQRHRYDRWMGWWVLKPRLRAGETVQWSRAAGRQQSALRTNGGRLFLTSGRLTHQPNRFDAMAGGRQWSTPRSSIKTIDVQPRTNVVPFLGMAAGLRNRLRVELNNGDVELFVVNRLGDVLSRLDSERGQRGVR